MILFIPASNEPYVEIIEEGADPKQEESGSAPLWDNKAALIACQFKFIHHLVKGSCLCG